MSAKFGNYIENHQLKNNIIITGIANEFVNLLGPSAFVDVQNITSCSAEKILIAYMAVKKIFDLDVIIDEIDNLDSSVPLYAQYSASYLLADIVKKSIYNVLSVFWADIENQKMLDKFIEIANDLHSNGIGQNKLFSAQSEEIYINDHLTKNLSKKLIIITKLRGIINIASIIVKTKSDIKNVSEIYNSVDKVMGLQSIKSTMSISKIGNYWDCVAIIKSLQSLSVLHSDIVAFLVTKKQNIKYFNKKCEISLIKYDSVTKKLKNASILAMSSLVIECMIDVKKELEIK
jgi:glutamate dehydrogenase